MNRAQAGQLVERFEALGLPARFVYDKGYQVLVNTEADHPAVVLYKAVEAEKLLAKIKAIKARTQEAARGS